MARGRYEAVLRQVRTLFDVGAVGGLTDGELLDRFGNGPGEVAELAFAVLVERHGPMVLRACRRALRDEHAAEDAFQATFLVLARKAGSVRRRDTLGPWLHGVACRVAACARSSAARRARHEREAASPVDRGAAVAERDDSGAAIHEEIDRLPDRYRWPIVLCGLEGLTREQAALRLGWRVGTVQSRLARGRERLRERLARRGLAPAVGTVAAALAVEAEAAMSAVPARLVEATVRWGIKCAAGRAAAGVVPAGVASLITGAFHAMLIRKLKAIAGAAAAVAVVGAGITWGQAQDAGDLRPRTPYARGGDPSADRLEKLELKIDHLIQALEGSAALTRMPDPRAAQAELAIAAERLKAAQDKAAWAESMAGKGYVAAAQVHAEKVAALEAEQAVVRAKARIDELDRARASAAQPKQPTQESVPPRPLFRSRVVETDRIDRLEQRIDALERRLDALERRGEEPRSRAPAPRATEAQPK